MASSNTPFVWKNYVHSLNESHDVVINLIALFTGWKMIAWLGGILLRETPHFPQLTLATSRNFMQISATQEESVRDNRQANKPKLSSCLTHNSPSSFNFQLFSCFISNFLSFFVLPSTLILLVHNRERMLFSITVTSYSIKVH